MLVLMLDQELLLMLLVEMLELLVLLDELVLLGLLLDMLDGLELLWLLLDELDELELDELELDELELWLDWLDWLELDMLLELDELELDRSSIAKMLSRSPELGPGNWSEPVWKLSTSGSLSAPPVSVSVSTACQSVLSAKVTSTTSVVLAIPELE